MSSAPQPPRTYNQNHALRKYTPGKRRVSIYWTWSYPWEANRDPTELDNRFSTMTEVRRVAWPAYEGTEWDEMHFLQGIAGTLELFHRSTLAFQRVVGEVTGHSVAVFQRIDQAGYRLPIDQRILADTDTLMVFGLDHLLSEQEAASGEIEALREWLKREGTCLLLGPHHDVGFTEDLQRRQLEYTHHGDALVPRQQRFGRYTRSIMKALGALPHYAVTTDDTKSVHVLTSQPIDLDRPHPFTQAGNTEFNSCIWMPPNAQRGGDILLADSTVFTTLFGGVESLETFWKNLATMPAGSQTRAKKTQAVA